MPDTDHKSRYRLYADLITVFHFLWTALLIVGIALMTIYSWYAWVQIGVMSLTLLLALPFGNTCPVTMLEERLRKKLDPSYTNNGAFIATYTNKILGTRYSTRGVNAVLAVFYVMAYALAIEALLRR